MGYFKEQSTLRASPGNSTPVLGFSQPQVQNIEKQNQVIKAWIPKVRRGLQSSAKQFTDGKTKSFIMRGNQKEGKLAKSIGSKTHKNGMAIEGVSFTFERHGVFVHKGVGRGGPGSREAVEWFNPIIEKYFPELADRITEINANAAVDATKMKIR